MSTNFNNDACMMKRRTLAITKSHHQTRKDLQLMWLHLWMLIDEMGNPFEGESDDLLCLATKAITDPSVHTTVKNVKVIGRSKYDAFVEERLRNRQKSPKDPISQNKLPLFKQRPQRTAPKDKMKLQSDKNNCQLFSKL